MAKKARRAGLSSLSVAEIQAELRRRQAGAKSLLRRREKALAKIAMLDEKLAALGVSASGGADALSGRKRPKNDMNLVEALAKVLKSKTLSVTDAAAAVLTSGYKTSAENFRTMVNQALIKRTDLFKKVSRGKYTAA
jgi:hypothetical protein